MQGYIQAIKKGWVVCGYTKHKFACPVDVAVYKGDTVVGKIEENEIREELTIIPAFILGDEKYFFLPDDGTYTIRVTATGEGTMTYTVTDEDAEDSESKSFENIRLETGKEMSSSVKKGADVQDSRLFVENESGSPAKEIKEDGSEVSVSPDDLPQDDGEFSINLVETAGFVYTGEKHTPGILVRSNGSVLKEGVGYSLTWQNNLNASTEIKKAAVLVSGRGDLKGKASINFDILPKSIAKGDTQGETTSVWALEPLYIAVGQKAVPVLIYNGYRLTNKDYTLDLTGKINGDTELTITGKGNFTGSRTVTVKAVQKAELKKLKIFAVNEKLTYDGTEKKLSDIKVTDAATKKSLTEGVDYTVLYSDNIIDAGSKKIVVTGLGLYSGCSAVIKYQLLPAKVKADVKTTSVTYSKNGTIPEITVTVGEKNLEEGKDYSLKLSGNTKAGKGKYTISFLGNFKGSTAVKGEYDVAKASISEAALLLPDMVYNGKPGIYASVPFITVGGDTLSKNDYTVKYYDENHREINAANKLTLDAMESETITAAIEGKGNYQGSISGTYKVIQLSGEEKSLSGAKITGVNGKTISGYSYKGSAIVPAIAVSLGSGKNAETVPDSGYDITCFNNVHKGTATILIRAKEGSGYAGSTSVTFKILPMNLQKIS